MPGPKKPSVRPLECGRTTSYVPEELTGDITSQVTHSIRFMLVGPKDYPFVFGHYVLEKSLAVGGMGEIYMATLRGVKRRCAIKTIRPEYIGNETLIHRFMDEGKIMVNIDHDNVVRCFDWGQVEDTYYIAMEYVHGTSVAELMDVGYARGARIPLGLCLYIAREVLTALSYLHRATDQQGRPLQLIHRDLSPDNVLLAYDGSVKLADFGLARAKLMPARTVGDVPLGKWGYMAPEQAKHGHIDNRTDIYGLGCSLFELFTGKRLIDDREKDLEVLFNKVLNPTHPRPTSIRKKLPAEFDDFISGAVQVNPANRYQDAETMRDTLDRLETKAAKAEDMAAYLAKCFPPNKIKPPPIPDTSQYEMRKDESVVFALSSATAQHALDLDELPSEWVNLDDTFDGEATVVPDLPAKAEFDGPGAMLPTLRVEDFPDSSERTIQIKEEIEKIEPNPSYHPALDAMHEDMPTIAEPVSDVVPGPRNSSSRPDRKTKQERHGIFDTPRTLATPIERTKPVKIDSVRVDSQIPKKVQQDDRLSQIIFWVSVVMLLASIALIAATFLTQDS